MQNYSFLNINQISIQMTSPQKQVMSKQTQQNIPKQEEFIYNVLQNKVKFNDVPFSQDDLHAQLVMKIELPNKEYILKRDYMNINDYVHQPDIHLQNAYQRVVSKLINEMEKQKENKDPQNYKYRLNQSFKQGIGKFSNKKIIKPDESEQRLELLCELQYKDRTDIFSLMINTIIYVLQAKCGFMLRAYVYKGDSQSSIYIMLNQSLANYIKLAEKYKIMKKMDYSLIDFNINDPGDIRQRPIKYNSLLVSEENYQQHSNYLKKIGRFFAVHQNFNPEKQIVSEIQMSQDDADRYQYFYEEMYKLFESIKFKQIKLQRRQRQYLYEYNRYKFNQGCENYYKIKRKRKMFFQLLKKLLDKHGYPYYEQPVVYGEFNTANSNFSFFDKLEVLLAFDPLTVSQDEKLSLFLQMQKIKLCFLSLKQGFRTQYLSKLGIEVFPLESVFEKVGNQNAKVQGGLDGQILKKKWHSYGFYSDTTVIRNYFGQQIAIHIKKLIFKMQILLPISIPFVVLFINEQIYQENIKVFTSIAQYILLAISFGVINELWSQKEKQFRQNFSERVKVVKFVSDFSGPYKRNIVNDEINQFRKDNSLIDGIKNLIVTLVLLAIIVFEGGIFHAARMMLLNIYEPLQNVQTINISISHIISYFTYFLISFALLNFIYVPIIGKLVIFQNFPSIFENRQTRTKYILTVALFIQVIPPFFFLIIEPFGETSCYANECSQEYIYYAYSRFVISIAIYSVKLIFDFVKSFGQQFVKLALINAEKKFESYPTSLAELLDSAEKESKKEEIALFSILGIFGQVNFALFAMHCTIFAAAPLVVLIILAIMHFDLRKSYIYKNRRPIDRSENIPNYEPTLVLYFAFGLFINAWLNTFTYEFVQKNFQSLAKTFLTDITFQAIFLFKFIFFAFFCLITILIYKLSKMATRVFSNDKLLNRKKNMLQKFVNKMEGESTHVKVIKMQPIKAIFRVFSPEKSSVQFMEEILNKTNSIKQDSQEFLIGSQQKILD